MFPTGKYLMEFYLNLPEKCTFLQVGLFIALPYSLFLLQCQINWTAFESAGCLRIWCRSWTRNGFRFLRFWGLIFNLYNISDLWTTGTCHQRPMDVEHRLDCNLSFVGLRSAKLDSKLNFSRSGGSQVFEK